MASLEIEFTVRGEDEAERLADALSDVGFGLVVGDLTGAGWTVVATSVDHTDHDRADAYVVMLAEVAASRVNTRSNKTIRSRLSNSWKNPPIVRRRPGAVVTIPEFQRQEPPPRADLAA